MRAIDRDIDSGILGEANCLKRLEHFGLAAAREIRAVLLAEHLLTSDADATLRYRAFAGLYLDLASFEPEAVGHYFPSLPAGPAVSHLLADGLDAEHLLAAMRPSGAADAILEGAIRRKRRAPRGRAGPIRQTGPIAAGGPGSGGTGESTSRAAILRAECGMVTTGDDRARALLGRGCRARPAGRCAGRCFQLERRNTPGVAAGSRPPPDAGGTWLLAAGGALSL